jgi:hypothetical protein
MNHPYMCPCDAPWTPEYQESHPKLDDYSGYSMDDVTEDEYLTFLHGII